MATPGKEKYPTQYTSQQAQAAEPNHLNSRQPDSQPSRTGAAGTVRSHHPQRTARSEERWSVWADYPGARELTVVRAGAGAMTMLEEKDRDSAIFGGGHCGEG